MRACLEVVWPNLYALLQDNSIEAVDLAMTEMITRHLPDGGSEELASFICYLVAATRQGHLCVMVGQGELLPDPLEVVAKPCQGALFTRMALDGAMAFFSVHCRKRLSSLITVYSCYVYLSRYAEIECICAEEIKRLAALSLTLSLKDDDLSPRLTSQQRKAVLTSLSSPFSLITGGPGTGKTFTAAELVRAFCCRLEHRGPPSILLAAPTGKAAAHLEKNVKKHIEFDAHISCGTLHALLSMHARRSGTRQGAPLCYDLMIVDEASMIDAALMRECLASVPLRGQLVLMGDPDQLPPVEVGSLFPELIKAAKEGAGIVFSELTECLRSDRKAILSLASAVNEQKETEALAILAAGDAAIQKRDFLDPETPDGRSYEALMRFVEPFFFYVLQGNLAPIEVLKQLDKFKVISCLRKGLHGVDTLNILLLSK
jgi:exodeoxyribonuclease V alpha subunit